MKTVNAAYLNYLTASLNGGADIDYNSLAHELREQQLMMSNPGMEYGVAHEQTLPEQGMYHRDYDKKLYTPEALKASTHN